MKHLPRASCAGILLFPLVLLACNLQDQSAAPLTIETDCLYQIAFGTESSIQLLDLSEGQTVNLTSDLDSAAYPAWSPDAQRLAFTSVVRNGTYSGAEVFTVKADGTDLARLTDHFGDYMRPSWSPDGSLILFSTPNYGYFQIGTVEVDPPHTETLLTSLRSKNLTPAWSPSGEFIAFSSNRSGAADIYVMDAQGDNTVRLTSSQGDDSWPAWSPDGTQIAFVSERDGNEEIYLMNADGSRQVNLTNDSHTDTMPSWSPDGAYLAFASDRRTRKFQIYLVRPDASDLIRLTSTSPGKYWPAWRPSCGDHQ